MFECRICDRKLATEKGVKLHVVRLHANTTGNLQVAFCYNPTAIDSSSDESQLIAVEEALQMFEESG